MPCVLELPGVRAIVAGVLLAEVGDPRRFPTADHFASYCGVAPVERGSAQNSRMLPAPPSESRWKSSSQLGAAHHCHGPIAYGRRSLQAIHGKTNRSRKDKTRRLTLDEDLYR